MKAVLIGSAAYRDGYADVDLIADKEFVENIKTPPESFKEGSKGVGYVFKIQNTILEISVPSPETAYDKVLKISQGSEREILGFKVIVCNLTVLTALKKAHLVIHHKWEHHINEYNVLKKLLKVEVFDPKQFGPEVADIYKTHRKEVQEGIKHPKLNTGKDYFFEEAEFKIFDHDNIHQAIALGTVPAYTLMLDGEVWCSRKKWDALSEEDKLRCVIEESAILALERSIIPSLYLDCRFRGAKWAYEFALSKVCTTITSGFFREYAIEHHKKAVEARPDYVKAFFEGIKKGMIKILKPEVVLG